MGRIICCSLFRRTIVLNYELRGAHSLLCILLTLLPASHQHSNRLLWACKRTPACHGDVMSTALTMDDLAVKEVAALTAAERSSLQGLSEGLLPEWSRCHAHSREAKTGTGAEELRPESAELCASAPGEQYLKSVSACRSTRRLVQHPAC